LMTLQETPSKFIPPSLILVNIFGIAVPSFHASMLEKYAPSSSRVIVPYCQSIRPRALKRGKRKLPLRLGLRGQQDFQTLILGGFVKFLIVLGIDNSLCKWYKTNCCICPMGQDAAHFYSIDRFSTLEIPEMTSVIIECSYSLHD
jgi:hypothetical protein